MRIVLGHVLGPDFYIQNPFFNPFKFYQKKRLKKGFKHIPNIVSSIYSNKRRVTGIVQNCRKKIRQNIPLSLTARKPNRFVFNQLWRLIGEPPSKLFCSQYYSYMICLLDLCQQSETKHFWNHPNKTDFMSATFPHDIECKGAFISYFNSLWTISTL